MTKNASIPFYDSARQGNVAWDEFLQTLRYKDLIIHLVRRDVTSRYKRSILGVAWTMLNPLGTMIILTIVFSGLFSSVQGYAAYILSGLLVWNFFSQSTVSGISSVVWGGDLFRRIYFPRSIFSISAVGTGLVNLLLSLVPYLGLCLIIGWRVNTNFFWFPVPLLLIAMFTLGLSLIIASLGIRFPDIVEMYNVALLAWMYLTPIIYPENILPSRLISLLKFNPMYHLVKLFRESVYDGYSPNLQLLGICILIATITLGLGWMIFSRMSDEITYRS